MNFIVVLKFVASCRWKCGLDKLSTILDKLYYYQIFQSKVSRDATSQ
jgi:hypothetical protein